MKVDVFVNEKDFMKALKKEKSVYLDCELEMGIKYGQKVTANVKDLSSDNIYDLKVWMELEG